MKVHYGPFLTWYGPHKIAEMIIFWDEKLAGKFGDWLSYKTGKPLPVKRGKLMETIKKDREDNHTWFRSFLEWVHTKRKRKEYIKLDPWDTWNVDSTLTPIILALLKQFKEKEIGIGCPYIDQYDIPKNLRSEDNYNHEGWKWIVDEMIWTFSMLDDEESEYHLMEGDWKAREERVQNGLILFAKYFRSLWS